jgi:hypothetical protein
MTMSTFKTFIYFSCLALLDWSVLDLFQNLERKRLDRYPEE